MPKFRKKPVEIEAIRWCDTEDSTHEVLRWANSEDVFYVTSDRENWIEVKTLEGSMRAMPGDWIIRGVHGELYPCKPDIFAATYKPA